MASTSLPPTHTALVLETVGNPFEAKQTPTPQPTPGSAIVRIEASGILSYHRDVYAGSRDYTFPTPLIGGTSAIGRIAAAGPDAVALCPGQLVYVDCTIHARDDPDSLFLTAIWDGLTPGSKKLMKDVWRDGTWGEYAKVPLENCIPLDEARLCQGLGYSIPDLLYSYYMLVPFGGLRAIDVRPGETVVVSPATGGFGGAGVLAAAAMGARVVAMGRNEEELARLKGWVLKGLPRAQVEIVKMTGDEMGDAETLRGFGRIDKVLDFTPPQAKDSPHVRSAVWALRRGGKVALMGFNENPVTPSITGMNISLVGKLMYERDDILAFVKMLEIGLFPIGKELVETKAFKLEQWEAAFDEAAKYTGVGRAVVFTP